MRTPGAFILLIIAGGAFGQVYECRTPSGNIVQQAGVPCAPGMDTKNPSREAASRKNAERQAEKAQKARELEAAADRREIRIGMNPEQVKRAWGDPTRHEVTEKADGETSTWWYWRCADFRRGSNAVLFKNGVVATIRTSCG